MLINFALNVVGTRVTSDQVSTDGYECSNLVSSNWHQRRKGFLAEHFIKPPVNITFEFPCNICIHRVTVSPCVGQQLTSHLELFSATKLTPRTVRGFQKLTANLQGGCTDSDASRSVSHSLPIFYPISKIYISDSSSVCFYNPKVSALSHGSMADISTYKHKAEIRHLKQEILSASSHLTLRIVRTANGSTAAVSNIDIWGLPSLAVPNTIRDDILNKYSEFLHQSSVTTNIKINDEKTVASKPTLPISCVLEECHELDIPEDFLDPITCEVMAIPMLLPSGKNVDQSTLDHYFSVESTYCRQPRDPFTGVEFSSTNKPIPNGALKARIDKFLLEHSSDSATFKIARTVGTQRNSSLLGKRTHSGNINGVSSVLLKTAVVQHLQLPSHNQTMVSSTSVVKEEAQSQQQCNHSGTLTSGDNGRSELVGGRTVSEVTPKLQLTPHSASCSNKLDYSSGNSHENQLKNSLNSALCSILSHLPSYPSHFQNSAAHDSCFSCNKALSIDHVSYVTPCHHYLCRSCLTADNVLSMSCRVCGSTFEKRDVLRRHQIT